MNATDEDKELENIVREIMGAINDDILGIIQKNYASDNKSSYEYHKDVTTKNLSTYNWQFSWFKEIGMTGKMKKTIAIAFSKMALFKYSSIGGYNESGKKKCKEIVKEKTIETCKIFATNNEEFKKVPITPQDFPDYESVPPFSKKR